ncbi:hypothetical protein EMIHUDRAFT_374167, partial [Emiliania huxleyi CCMP1516]|uniref:Uncharacterized protein n=2 Tax=Emiliania huxleyi TaxID=2903 RepID=A0A0D3IXU3_EMIH1
MWASGPAAAARPVEAGLGPARDGWPPTSALALLVKMAAVAIAATKVQAYSAQAPVVFRLLSHFAHPRAPRGHEPSAIRSRSQKLLARTAADSAIAAAAVELFAEDWCLICCLPADVRHSWHPMGRPEYRPLACQSRSLDDPHEVQRSPSRWPLRRPPRPRRTHRRGLSRLRDRPQLRL